VDKTPKGRLKTSKVMVEGWPAAIFLSTERRYVEEFSTRCLTVSPDESQEKITAAVDLQVSKASCPWRFEEQTEEEAVLKEAIRNIKGFFLDSRSHVVIPYSSVGGLLPKAEIRDMRDAQHFIQLIYTYVALNFKQRPLLELSRDKEDKRLYVVASPEDVENAISLFSKIYETTYAGVERRIIQFYKDVLLKGEQWHLSEMRQSWNEKAQKKVSERTIERWIKQLMDIGFVGEQPDPNDGRMKIYKPLVKAEEISRILTQSSCVNNSKPCLLEEAQNWLKKLTTQMPLANNTSKPYAVKLYKTEDKGTYYDFVEIDEKEFIDILNGTDKVITSYIEAKPDQTQANQGSYMSKGVPCRQFSEQKLNSFSQTEAEIRDAQPLRQSAPNSSEHKIPIKELYKPFIVKCGYCNCQFLSQDDLRRHLTTHKVERDRLLDALAKVENMEVD